MTPDMRRRRRSVVQRVVTYRSIIRARDAATEAEAGRTLLVMTRDSWQRLAVVPSVGSIPLLLPAAELTTAVPIASGIMMVTALTANWFLPRAEIGKIKLKDIKPDYWFVLRRGPTTITVTEVIASIHPYPASQVTLALRTGWTRYGQPDEEVEIADLKDPFQRWRRPRRAFAESRDLSAIQQIVTLVEAHQAPRREELTDLATKEGVNHPDANIDGAIVVGFIREEYNQLRPTPAGHAWLTGTTQDKQNVRKFLDAIGANVEVLRRQLPEIEIQQVEAQIKFLNAKVSSGQLHTSEAKRALGKVLKIAGHLILGASGNALYEALAHFAGLG